MNAHKNRRGVALLIVIGLLSLLLISTVAFSVLMTTERSAAGNYRHTIQARQMLYAGLAKALADINNDVGDGAPYYPQWTMGSLLVTNLGSSPLTRSVPCMADVLQSIDTSPANPAGLPFTPCYAKVISAPAMNYIPRSLWKSAQTVQPEYVPLSGAGRCAYVAVNVSGLLDANTVFTNTNGRWVGVDPGEIQVTNTILKDVLDPNWFAQDKQQFQRYESVAELAQLNTGIAQPGVTNVSNFETFSYAPQPEYQPDGVTPKVFIGYDPSLAPLTAAQQLQAKSADISNAFAKCIGDVSTPLPGLNPALSPVTVAYNSLIDYASGPTDPVFGADGNQSELARPASRDAPMIQSVPMMMTYSRTAANNVAGTNWYTHTIKYDFPIAIVRPCVTNSAATTYTATYIVSNNVYLMNAGTVASFKNLLPFPTVTDFLHSPSTNLVSATISLSCGKAASTVIPQIPTSVTVTNLFVTNICALAFAVRVTDPTGTIIYDQVPAGNGFADSSRFIYIYYKKTFGSAVTTAIPNQYDIIWSEALDPTINWNGHSLNGGQWIASESDSTVAGWNSWFNASLLSLSKNANFPGLLLSSPNPNWSDAYYTWVNRVTAAKCLGGGLTGGALSSYLLTNSTALAWWNLNSATVVWMQSVPIIPDGATLGAPSTQWDNLILQQRHYVKGAALTTVGELGYLPIGRWMTINLYPHNHMLSGNTANMLPAWGYHRILDYFTTRLPNGPVRGLVQVHSTNVQVQASVFAQMPLNEVGAPVPVAPPVGPADARALGNRFLACSASMTNNLSDLGEIMRGSQTNAYSAAYGALSFASSGELEREAVVRNSANLYTTRHQLYTIIVRADAISTAYGGGATGQGNPLSSSSALGSAQAVFQVWRDPIKDANGNHPCFVRLCKIMSL